MKRTALFGALLAGAVMFACGDDPVPTVTASLDSTTFTSGSTVTLTLTTTDFELRAPGGQHALRAAADGHDGHETADGDKHIVNAGHFHVYLDSTTENPILQGHKSPVSFPVVATPGAHKLIVRLNDDSHKFLVPEVMAHVNVTVQ